MKAHENPWVTIPEEDLQRTGDDVCASLEVEIDHPLLKDNANIMVPPDCHIDHLPEILNKYMSNTLPVIIYAVSEDILSDSVNTNDFFANSNSFVSEYSRNS
mgnify:CR=1 FL=1